MSVLIILVKVLTTALLNKTFFKVIKFFFLLLLSVFYITVNFSNVSCRIDITAEEVHIISSSLELLKSVFLTCITSSPSEKFSNSVYLSFILQQTDLNS